MPTGHELCRQAEARLTAAGVPDPARDLRHLFLHALAVAGQPVARHHLAEVLARPVPDTVTTRRRAGASQSTGTAVSGIAASTSSAQQASGTSTSTTDWSPYQSHPRMAPR